MSGIFYRAFYFSFQSNCIRYLLSFMCVYIYGGQRQLSAIPSLCKLFETVPLDVHHSICPTTWPRNFQRLSCLCLSSCLLIRDLRLILKHTALKGLYLNVDSCVCATILPIASSLQLCYPHFANKLNQLRDYVTFQNELTTHMYYRSKILHLILLGSPLLQKDIQATTSIL